MCNNHDIIMDFEILQSPVGNPLGDGHALKATGRGTVMVRTKLRNGKTYRCYLKDVLLVPNLAYNLISVARVTDFSAGTC